MRSFRFQVPDDQKVSSQSAAVNSGGMGVYSFAVPISPPQQQQQHVMSASPHQQPAPAFVASQPMLASAGLVLVPADSLSAQPASAPVLWQVASTNSQPAVPIGTENPAFFRVTASAAAGASSLPIIDTCPPGSSQPFATNFTSHMQPVANMLPASAAEYILQNVTSCHMMTTPADTVTTADQIASLRNASSIPDIVLTGAIYIALFVHSVVTIIVSKSKSQLKKSSEIEITIFSLWGRLIMILMLFMSNV